MNVPLLIVLPYDFAKGILRRSPMEETLPAETDLERDSGDDGARSVRSIRATSPSLQSPSLQSPGPQSPMAQDALSVVPLQKALNAIPAYTWYATPSGALTFVNERTGNYLGLPKDHPLRLGLDVEATWDSHISLLHPDDHDETRRVWSNCLKTGAAGEVIFRVRNAHDVYRWFASRAEPLRASDGSVLFWIGINLDIDDRKKADDALRESEYKLRQIIETMPGLVWTTGPDGEPTHLNQRLLDYSGMRLDEFLRLGWKKVLHPDDFANSANAFNAAIRTGIPYHAVCRLLRADGEYRWHHARAEPLRDAGGRIVQWYGLSVDVDEAKRTEERLRRSEAYLAEAQRLSRAGTYCVAIIPPGEGFRGDQAFPRKIVYWSEENYRIWGFDPLHGLPSYDALWERVHPDDRDRVRKVLLEALHERRDYSIGARIVLPDGTTKFLEATGHHIFSASGDLVEVVGTHIDVTERKRVERAVRESEAKFREYAETASDWFWETGPDYKFTLLTENAFGGEPESRLGTTCWAHALDLETAPDKWRTVWATLDARKPFRDFVYLSARGDGSPMYVKASGKPVFDDKGAFNGYRGTATDVTALMRAQEEHEKLRRLESDLAHKNRLTMMGELTASLAHEITQPIATARNNARAALRFLDRNPPSLSEVREALECLVGDADRAGDIVGRIRDQIKKAPPRKEHFDLNKAINEVIALAGSAITTNGVSTRTRLAGAVFPVEGDRVQLQQVVLNLILNAVEAMSTNDGGPRELLISTEQPQAGGVLVSVRDTGPGIDPEHFARVFEAFYTTKSSGVGMGLAICRSIIDGHGGRLWAVNEPGGALFQFTLPVSDSST